MDEFARLIIYILIVLGYFVFKTFGKKISSPFPTKEPWNDFDHPALSRETKQEAETTEAKNGFPIEDQLRGEKTISNAGEKQVRKVNGHRVEVKARTGQLVDEEGLKPIEYWDNLKKNDLQKQAEKTIKTHQLIRDKNDLVRGIILSEILGPPRSRRPYRPNYQNFRPG